MKGQDKYFIDAAAIVRNILNGEWSNDRPDWADATHSNAFQYVEDEDAVYTRAWATAEAFIMLFTSHNPRFDTNRFLIACGLVSAPAKKGRK